MQEKPKKQNKMKAWWEDLKERRPGLAQFIMFFIISNGVTVLQLAMMPILRNIFAGTQLVYTSFQVFPVGTTVEGYSHFIFNYPAGPITAEGVGGGLAYFLAVQISLGVAQIINFFLQRNVTFKANNSVWKAAMWYLIAYTVITFAAGAAQGLYKAPIYSALIGAFGNTGETLADVVTMIINAAISFWVFFPIFRLIFKNKPEDATKKES